MAVLRRLDAAAVRRWCTTALVDLRARRQEIDDINVYPVPDGDAGTNMVATMAAADASLRRTRADNLAATMKALARGALVGARGNSGVILSQVLSGFADVLGPVRSAGGEKLKEALDHAVSKAYAAVAQPAEGTILTVARGAAKAARAVDGDDFAAVIKAAAAGAREALGRTTEQLPALKAAGVVDAGGRGLVVVLEALARVMGAGEADGRLQPEQLVRRDAAALVGAREGGSPQFGYEVQFLLDSPDHAIGPLKEALGRLGDSLVVVGSDGVSNVHVHVNDVGAALEAAVSAGRPHRISVTRFADQILEQEADHNAGRKADHRPEQLKSAPERALGARAVVAFAEGTGLCRLFAQAGAIVVPPATSRAELASVLEGSGADEVILLPNSAQLLGLAAAVQAASKLCHVHVIPTRAAVQGLAALAVHDSARALADDVIAMTSAAAGTLCGRVTVAERALQTSAGSCRSGEPLGLVDGEVVSAGSDLVEVAVGVLDRMRLATAELVTFVAGVRMTDAMMTAVIARVHAAYPVVQVETYRGEQSTETLLIGVE